MISVAKYIPSDSYSNLVELLITQSDRYNNKVAYTFLSDKGTEESHFTYQGLSERAKAIAAVLQSKNLGGERALMLFPSGLEFVATFFGCLFAGVIAVPAYPPRKNNNAERVDGIIKDCDAKLILTTDTIRKSLERTHPELFTDYNVEVICYEEIDNSQSVDWVMPQIQTNSLAFLQYTSGSTGMPKGVMVGHDNLLANLKDLSLGAAHTSQSVMVSWLPAFHDLGLIAGILLTVYEGFSCYLMSPVAFLIKPYRWLKAISDFKATHTVAPNFAFEQCISTVTDEMTANLDLSSLQYLGNCAEPVRANTLQQFEEKFRIANLRENVIKPGYGLAEATLKVTSKTPNAEKIVYLNVNNSSIEQNQIKVETDSSAESRTLVGCGKTEVDTIIKIVNPATQCECKENEVGEIWVAGSTVCKGYWQKEEQTRETFNAYLTENQEGPFLRTGDLGFVYSGELFVTGRIKDLVIINGKNHYPQDIERSVEVAHAALRKGFSVAFSVEKDNKEHLVVVQEIANQYFKTFNAAETTEAIRQAVSREHNLEVTSVVLIEPNTLPKTSSGKVQRRATKQKYLEGSLAIMAEHSGNTNEGVYAAPRTRTETLVQKVWQSIFRKNQISITESFVSLGGDSIKATQIIANLNQVFSVSLDFEDIFDKDTIAELAQLVDSISAKADSINEIEAIQVAESYVVSPTQKVLWLANQMEQTQAVYNIPVCYELEGEINVDYFQEAFEIIINRHESLRTSFVMEGGEIRQKIAKNVNIKQNFNFINIADATDVQVKCNELMSEIARQPFNLEIAPLVNISLFQLSENQFNCLINIHHIVADEWSMEIFIKELSLVYQALRNQASPNLPSLSIQYKDFVSYQAKMMQTPVGLQHQTYWQNQLEKPVVTAEIPVDFARVLPKNYEGATLRDTLSGAETERLIGFVKEQNSTIFVSLLANLQLLLAQYTQVEDVVVGTPVAGREHPALHNQIGYYVNTLALKGSVNAEHTVAQHLQDVRKNTFESFKHQSYPLEKVQPFDVMMVMYNNDLNLQESLDGTGFSIKDYRQVSPYSKFDMTFYFKITPSGLGIELTYNTSLFEESRALVILEHFKNMLNAMIESSDKIIGDLTYVSAVEKQKLVEKFNHVQVRQDIYPSIKERFELIAFENSSNAAVVCGSRVLTYRELNKKANRLAHFMQQRYQIGIGDVVAVKMRRSEELIISLIAILKTGASYLPVDNSFPEERVAFMLNDSGSKLMIVDEVVTNFSVVTLLFDENVWCDKSSYNTIITKALNDVVYTIYTSGSTGLPKGVNIPERGLLNYVAWFAQTYRLRHNDSTLLLSSVAFDLGYTSLWTSILSGCSLHILPEHEYFDANECLSTLIDHKITYLKLTPSHFNMLVNHVDMPQKAKDLALRLVVMGGEKIRPQDIEFFASCNTKETLFVNHYGPTETTIGVITQNILTKDNSQYVGSSLKKFAQRPIIGRPIHNTQIYVLDARNKVSGIGVWGELCIGGDGLSTGYVNRPELNLEKFIDNPFKAEQKIYRSGDVARWLADGTIELMGRQDNQVKIRGYRVELGEIEQCIRQHENVSEVAVLYKNHRLIAYFSAIDISKEGLKQYIAQKLPSYMVPNCFVSLENFPMLGNGKINRQALPMPEETDLGDIILAETKEEVVLAVAFREVFGVEEVNMQSDFFQFGGDSIKAMQIVAHLHQLGYQLKVKDIFKNPILGSMALCLELIEYNAFQGEVTGKVGLTPIQKDFFNRQYADFQYYNQAVLLKSERRLNTNWTKDAFLNIQKHHDALRMIFDKNHDQYSETIDMYLDFELVDLQSVAEPSTALTQHAQRLQMSMSFEKGSLMKIRLFRMNDGDRLLIVIHHLVVDGMSWRVILEDFNTAYNQLSIQRSVQLPLKTDSYQAWSQNLERIAPKIVDEEFVYWNRIQMADHQWLPMQKRDSLGVNKIKKQVPTKISKALFEQTSIIQEKLLSALASTLDEIFEQTNSCIMMEGHGREEIINNINVNRTVGWFTSLFPFQLKWEKELTALENLKNVQQSLAQVPNKGIGYGIIKHLTNAFETALKPQISFNYLGDFDKTLSATGMTEALEDFGATSNQNEKPNYALSVMAMAKNDSLVLSVTYDESCWSKVVMNDFVEVFFEKLGEVAPLKLVIDHHENQHQLSELLISKVAESAFYDVSQAQKRFWFIDQLEQGVKSYNMVRALKINGQFNVDAFRQSVQALVMRHESLRTNIVTINGEPQQKINAFDATQYDLVQYDFSSEKNAEELAKKEMFTLSKSSFDLSNGALCKFILFKINDSTHIFQYVIHHIVVDGWSMSTLKQELLSFYRGFCQGQTIQLAPLKFQYKDYAAWQNALLESEAIQGAKKYWQNQLQGSIPVLEIPTDFERPLSKNFDSKQVSFDFDKVLSQQIKSLARQQKVSSFTVLMSLVKTLLYRYSGQEELIIGTPVSGRETSNTHNQVGLYLNTLPIRTHFDENLTFADLLTKSSQTLQDANENQLYPFDKMVDDLKVERDMSRSPLFDVLVASENFVKTASISETLSFEYFDTGFSANKFDLSFYFEDINQEISLKIAYNLSLFLPDRIQRMGEHLLKMAQSLIENPNQEISRVEYITSSEKEYFLNTFNDTIADFSKDKKLHQLFEEQVFKTPNSTALKLEDLEMSYDFLNQKANQLARHLIANGLKNAEKVGLICGRNFEMMIGMLGILKAGGVYVPIDPDYPAERQNYILQNSAVNTVVVVAQNITGLQNGCKLVSISHSDYDKYTTGNLNLEKPSTDLAYIIYTSGSTGRPKGVMITHQSAVNLVESINNQFEIDEKENAIFLTSMCFDLSVYDIFGILAKGGTLVITNPEMIRDIDTLKALIQNESITLWNSVPTTFDYLITALENSSNPFVQNELKIVMLSGDWIPVSLSDRMKPFFPNAKLISLGGATEATVWSNTFIVDKVEETWKSIPYGKPIQNNFFYILDKHLNLVPKGVIGELYIGGIGVAEGYMNDPEKTKNAFLNDPFITKLGGKMYRTGDLGRLMNDGNMEFLGRKDNQVKIRGYRIEMGEIETQLSKHPMVDGVIVNVLSDTSKTQHLVAYYVGKTIIDSEDLFAHCQQTLPHYMIPSYFVKISEIPLNINGKIDRKALPKPAQISGLSTNHANVLPQTETEKKVAEVWKRFLNRDDIYQQDNFFSLGGHSLLASQVIAVLNEELNIKINLKKIFTNPTLEKIAAEIDAILWIKHSTQANSFSESSNEILI